MNFKAQLKKNYGRVYVIGAAGFWLKRMKRIRKVKPNETPRNLAAR